MQRQERLDDWVERNQRHGVSFPAVAYRSDGTNIRVHLRNMSYEGCQMDTQKVLLVGEILTIRLSGLGDVFAEVRWATKDRAGARFEVEEPLLAEKPPRDFFSGC